MINRTGDRGRGRGEGVARPWDADSGADYASHSPSFRNRVEEAVNLLMRRKWLVLLSCVVVVAGMTWYTLSQDPVYDTGGLVLISDRNIQEGFRGPDAQGERDLFARSDRTLENELLILRNSNALRRAVAERLTEKQVLPGTDRTIPLLLNAEGEQRPKDEIALILSGLVNFYPAGREVNAIQVRGQSNNPHQAALIANLFLEEYVQLTERSSRSSLTNTRSFLEEQVEARYEELDEIELEIQEYMRQEGAVALDGEGTRLIQRIAEVEANRDAAEVELATRRNALESREAELNAISPRLASRIASGVEREIEATQQKIAEAEQARQEIRAQEEERRTPADRTRLQQIDRRIEQYRAEVEQLSEQYVDEVLGVGGIGLSAGEGLTHVTNLQREIVNERIEISGLESELAMLEQRLAEYEAELETVPVQARELAQLQRSKNYAETMYRNLVEQLQEVRIREQSAPGYADRISEAFVPTRPSEPNIPRNLTIGVILGLLLGVGAAVGRDQMDSRLYKPDEIRETGQRLIGVVPDMQPFLEEKFKGASRVEYRDRMVSSTLVSALTPSSPPSEAYRHIRTNLQFSRPDEVLETIMVTGPGIGDGKSVTAANLAVSIAQSGRRTLLLDGDLRRPQVHNLFGINRSPGLSNHLTDGVDSPLSMKRTIQDNLFVIPAGDGVQKPSELFAGRGFRNLLTSLKEHFDAIVIDTPPVLAVTDATLLSTQCDATLMVARAATTTRYELEEAIDMLNEVGSTVEGVVFNGFKVSMAYGYKMRYRHYATYGHYGSYTSDDVEGDGEVPTGVKA